MIVCRELFAGYGAREVLHGVGFAAGAGEFVAVLGPNGSGKTTLLHALSGVLPVPPGHIRLADAPLESLSPRQRARRVAAVPQRVETLPAIAVRDMVLLGRYPYLSWLGAYGAADYAAADAALAAVGAEELAARPLRELSGGEVQRVLLARALAQEAPVLLLDELSAGLDMARMVELFDVLDERRRAGACVITVMHDVNLAALYATRLLGLKAGRVCFDGPVGQVFTEEHLRSLYDIPIHVFPHPVEPRPQACPGRRPRAQSAAQGSAGAAGGAADVGDTGAGGHQRQG